MIGDHLVMFIPDPDVQAWGPQLASNYGLDANLAGWGTQPFGTSTWLWDAGWAKATNNPPVDAQRSWLLVRRADAPIPRTAATVYQIRTRVNVSAATPVVLILNFGLSPEAANGGPFWYPTEAISRELWLWAPTAGTHTLTATLDPSGIGPEFAYLAPVVQVWPGTRPFPTPPRIDSIELQGQGAVATDITCLVDQVSIHHGREDTDSQPEAATCTLSLSTSTGASPTEDVPSSLEVGGIVRVATTLGAAARSTRFVGRITDITLAWDEAGKTRPTARRCR